MGLFEGPVCMTAPIYAFKRGEPIAIGRRVLSVIGDPAQFTPLARIKVTTGQFVPPAATPVVATFAQEFRPAVPAQGATPAQPAEWLLTLADGLPNGWYCTDVAWLLGGEIVDITEHCFLRITESVSG